MTDAYDSAPDTIAHIARVRDLLTAVRRNLLDRAMAHDASKLLPPEKAHFDAVGPNLRGLDYDGPAYKAALAALGDGLKHHYAENGHHPEHYPDGIAGMSLLDLIEMSVDWKAASERHATGDYGKSLVANRKRFVIEDQLFSVLVNTAKTLGFVPEDWSADG